MFNVSFQVSLSVLFEVGSRLVMLVPYYKPNIPGVIVSLLLLLFWLFLLGYLIGWIDKIQSNVKPEPSAGRGLGGRRFDDSGGGAYLSFW